jgi:hypothetical protein
MDTLASNPNPDFHITPEIKSQVLVISGRQIERPLKPAKDTLRRWYRRCAGATVSLKT